MMRRFYSHLDLMNSDRFYFVTSGEALLSADVENIPGRCFDFMSLSWLLAFPIPLSTATYYLPPACHHLASPGSLPPPSSCSSSYIFHVSIFLYYLPLISFLPA
jgi:hypothetical protein